MIVAVMVLAVLLAAVVGTLIPMLYYQRRAVARPPRPLPSSSRRWLGSGVGPTWPKRS